MNNIVTLRYMHDQMCMLRIENLIYSFVAIIRDDDHNAGASTDKNIIYTIMNNVMLRNPIIYINLLVIYKIVCVCVCAFSGTAGVLCVFVFF